MLGNGNYGRVYLVHDPNKRRSCTREPCRVCESLLGQAVHSQWRTINALISLLLYVAGKGRPHRVLRPFLVSLGS
jgi:hypothetical protein